MTASHSTIKFRELFFRYLHAEKVETVFGIPGGLLHPFFAGIEDDPNLSLIVAKHEEGAVFMADGYARTRGLGVVAGTAGPGATNMLTGVAVSYSSGVPLLVITGQVPSTDFGKGASQETSREEIDIVGMFRPVTKYSATVSSPGQLSHHLRRALRSALTGRPGPVHLNIPVDFWSAEVRDEEPNPQTYRPSTAVFDRNAVMQAANLLTTASKPVIIAGSGIATARAREQLITVAEQLRARVATTPTAKGIFPENHPLSLGVVGLAGHAPARDCLLGDDVDVLFCVGTSLNERATYNWHPDFARNAQIIQVDIDVDHIGRAIPVDLAVVGDAKTVLTEIFFHNRRAMEETPLASQWDYPLESPLMREETYLRPDLRARTEGRVTPQRWRRELVENLPRTARIFSDIGGHMLFNIHDLRIEDQQEFWINLGFASMGHGTVAPIGAALADRSRPVFAIVGDACFTMNGMEIIAAVDYDVPVIWIVENNDMHGVTWHGSKKVSGGKGMESVRNKKPLKVSAIAQAMGANVWIVDRAGELPEAVRQALGTGGPCVIEVRVDVEIPPPLEDRAELIGGFRK